MSLRRLNLCFCDLFDMLESCVESIDNAKKRAIYAQIEPSIALIKVGVARGADGQNSLSDIQHNYAAQLEKEGISFSFADVDQGLDAFCEAVREESHKLLSVKPASYHPNILLVMTSGLNVEDVEDSIRRYIPRNDVFPCDEQPALHPHLRRVRPQRQLHPARLAGHHGVGGRGRRRAPQSRGLRGAAQAARGDPVEQVAAGCGAES